MRGTIADQKGGHVTQGKKEGITISNVPERKT